MASSIMDLLPGLPSALPDEPMALFAGWYEDAVAEKKVPNPEAMALATASHDGMPSVRMVLVKKIDPAKPELVFFTNYTSRKGGEIAANPRIAGTFHWDHAQRQVRIEGIAERTTDRESDEYFAGRALLSRLGAWASDQSRPLASRQELLDRLRGVMDRFGVTWPEVVVGRSGASIPRPAHWGGFRVRLSRVELWMSTVGRLHDRAAWTRDPAVLPTKWTSQRLFP